MLRLTLALGACCFFKVQDPRSIELANDRTETYLRSIREHLTPHVQMVVIIFPTSRDDRYSAVKKLCCVESPVPSQVSPCTVGALKELVTFLANVCSYSLVIAWTEL